MLWVRRVAIHNAGHKEAWFSDLVFDLRDGRTGEPGHAIVLAQNGGGKTSFLSFFFSLFRPRRSDFLQIKAQASARFEDYFVDGLPAVMAVELSPVERRGLLPEEDRVVAGQIIVVRNDRSGSGDKRWFFFFRQTADLSFDDIPLPGLSGATLLSAGAADEWLHEMQRAHPGNFRVVAENQGEWLRLLENEGVDADSFGRQTSLNFGEGNVRTFLASLKSETAFLRMFFELILPESKTDDARDVLVSATQKLAETAEREESLRLVGGLSDAVSQFAEKAGKVTAAEALRRNAAVEAAEARGLAEAARARIESRMPDNAREADGAREEATAARSDELDARAAAQGYALCGADLALEIARQEVNAAHERKAASAKAIQAADAAPLLVELKSIRERLAEFRAVAAERSREVAPFETRKQEAGAAFAAAIERAQAGVVAAADRVEADLSAAVAELEQLDELERGLLEKRFQAEREIGGHRTRIDGWRRSLEWLRSRGALGPEEEAAPALDRLEARSSVLAERAASLREGAVAAEEDAAAASRLRDQEMKAAAETGRSLERVQETIRRAEAARRAIAEDVAWEGVLDEPPDADADQLPGILERAVEQREARLREIRWNLFLERADEQSIAEFGVAVDAETEKVVNALREAGIAHARPWGLQISDIGLDGAKGREMVESDPARFSGVVVDTQDQMERAAEACAGVSLRRPVVVSLNRIGDVEKPADRLVVMPSDDSGWSSAAAHDFRARLEERVASLRNREGEVSSSLEALKRVGLRLAEYRWEFGGRIVGLRDEEASLAEEFSARNSEVALQEARMSEATGRARKARGDLEAASGEKVETDRLCDAVRRHCDEHEAGLAGVRERIVEAEEELAEANNGLGGVADARKRLSAKENSLRGRQSDLRHEADSLATRRAGVEEEAGDAPDAPLAAVEARYTAAVDSLKAARAELFGPIEGRIGELEGAESKKAVEYERAVQGLNESVVEELAGRDDLERLRADARAESESAAEAFGNANTSLSIADRNRDALKKQHRDSGLPEVVIPRDSVATPEEARARAKDLLVEAEAAKRREQAALARLTKLESEEADLKRMADDMRHAAALVEGVADSEWSGSVDEPNIDQDAVNAVRDLVASALKRCQEAERAVENEKRPCKGAFERLKRLASTDEFRAREGGISARIQSYEFESCYLAADQIVEAVEQRIGTLKADIEDRELAVNTCVERMLSLYTDAVDALRRAESFTVPEGVPHIGGKPVLRFRRGPWKSGGEPPRDRIRSYVLRLGMEEKRIPDDGRSLASEIVAHVAGGADAMGIEVLKASDVGTADYYPPTGLNASGGQYITTCVLLFMVTCTVRAEQRVGRRGARGMTLLLDNTIGAASTMSLVAAQLSMADRLGVQLISPTAHDDPNLLEAYRNVIVMSRERTISVNGTRRMSIGTVKQTVAPREREMA